MVCETWRKSPVLDALIGKGDKMTKATIKIDLRLDESFRDLLLSQRAQWLALVDGAEKFLDMPRTKDLRNEVKRLRYEIEKLRQENNSVL